MIIGAEIGMLIYGLFALVKGEFGLGKEKKIYGLPARLCALICLAPLPLRFCGGFAYGFCLGLSGVDPERIAVDYRPIFAGIEIGVLVLVIIFVSIISQMIYKKQQAQTY
jgi:hypothetical protein